MNLVKAAAAFAVVLMMAVAAAPAVAGEGNSVNVSVNILEPIPDVAITVDAESIDFGDMRPGQTSDPADLTVSNIGLKPVDVTIDVEEEGPEAIFAPGIKIDGADCSEYLTTLARDGSDSFGVTLQLPADVTSRGEAEGDLVIWAVEHAQTVSGADFAANVTSGIAPLSVHFTDLSTNDPNSWDWDFDNDGTADSHDQNPDYVYTDPGTYTVKLVASNATGSDDEVKTAYIVVSAPTIPQQDWAVFQGNLYHDGITTNQGPISSASQSWLSEQMSSASMSGIDVAPIVADGKVFVIDMKGYVYAYSVSDGTKLWENQSLGLGTSGFQLSTPVYHDGVLYVALIRGPGQGVDVYALNADDGTAIWSRMRIVTGFYQPNTPVIYDDDRIYFGTWYSDEDEIGTYYCLNAADGSTLWSRSASSGQGYYWAGAAIIGNFLVYGDEAGTLVSVNKVNGDTVQEKTVNEVFEIPNSNIHSSITYSEQTHRIYFTVKGGYCLALGFDADTGSFVTTDQWSQNIGFSTSTPTVYNDKVYVGTGDFSDTNGNTLYCLNENDGSVAWSFVANGGIQASPIVSLNDDGQAYVYFTSNILNGRAYCLDSSGNQKWYFEPPTGQNQYILQGVAIYDGKVLFGNDAGYLFALGGA